MTLDDLKRLLSRQTLFRLDAILSPKLVPILYALGLAAILLWAVSHLFMSFATGFGNGLWGILEILVFGLLSIVALRIGAEALLVYFKAHQSSGESVERTRYSASLLDEVRDAIRDLAEHGDDDIGEANEFDGAPAQPYRAASTIDDDLEVGDDDDNLEADIARSTPAAPATRPGEAYKSVRPAPVKRTARRTPKPPVT